MEVELNREDILRIREIVKGYVAAEEHKTSDTKYVDILQQIADGMCWDDRIVADEYSTRYTHG